MRRISLIIFLAWFAFLPAMSAFGQPKLTGRYASIIVDADNLDVIHARQIDELRYPASLTKVMTLYLTFDALNSGQLRLDENIKVSRSAARAEPTKLGLRTGQTITVDQLIRALTVRSANDASIVLAERLAGSEEAFAMQMTAKARSLGLSRTSFKTANGLPHPEQITTARDMAKLANAVLVNHRRHYHYFGLESFTYKGRKYKNTNKLLGLRSDVDGFKTGFTNDSGYNLIVSAQRDGRRLIAVVLGGASGASRNSHMSDLIDRGFDVMGVKPQVITLAQNNDAPKQVVETTNQPRQIIRLRPKQTYKTVQAKTIQTNTIQTNTMNARTQPTTAPKDNWSIQIGAFSTEKAASTHIETVSILRELSGASPNIRKTDKLFIARMGGLSAQSAQQACKALVKSRYECLIIGPSQ